MSKYRNITGILLLDKPPGISSNNALQQVKRIYHAKKAGHTGSLDPLASGMLPICLGAATKFSQYLLDADKSYKVACKLGIKTATGDSEGEVVAEKSVPNFTVAEIEKVLANYRGEITQIPSMYSAIKYKGQPLYKLARQGITVEREPRKLTIYKLAISGFAKDILDLEVNCSKGTYIRTLVEDIGNDLGCGAHVIALRRYDVGPFKAEQMITLTKLQQLIEERAFSELDELLLPIEIIVAAWPEVRLTEAGAFYLKQGQAIIAPYAPTEGMVQLKLKDGRFIGIGEILPDGKVAPRRLLV